jgi:hypothetical protein
MIQLSRRKLLALGSSSLLALWAAYEWNFGDPADVVVAILKRRVGHLRVDHESFRTFAKDYLVFRSTYEKDLRRLSVASLPLRFMSPYAWLEQGHPLRRLEDNVVSKYLLSTDFFQNGGNDRTLVKYLSFYDPYRAVCRNPLAKKG